MEWLKENGIRQIFTSTYDSQTNGVAERWINLIKTKATALLASKYMHTSFGVMQLFGWLDVTTRKFWDRNPEKIFPSSDKFFLFELREITNWKNGDA